MRGNQERLFQVGQMISAVANCLIDLSSFDQPIEVYDAMELAGRLDIAVDAIRQLNGGSE